MIILNIIFFLYLFIDNLYALDHNTHIINDITKSNWEGKFDIGEILIWPFSHINPSKNWIECNGDIVNKIEYPKFFTDNAFNFNNNIFMAKSNSLLHAYPNHSGLHYEKKKNFNDLYYTIDLHKNQIQNFVQTPIHKRIKLSGKWYGHQTYQSNVNYGKVISTTNPNVTYVNIPMPAWKSYPEEVVFYDNANTIFYQPIENSSSFLNPFSKWMTNPGTIFGNKTDNYRFKIDQPIVFVPGTSPANENVPRHVYVRYFMRAR